MLAAVTDYPLLDIFLSILYFFLFFIWIYILITVFIDIFRSPDLGGGAKALWFLFVLILPLAGVLVYLIARGGKMHEHAVSAARNQEQAFQDAVRKAAGGSGVADQLATLADLKDRGVLTDAEFEAEKARLLG